jgi:hypothetical protein
MGRKVSPRDLNISQECSEAAREDRAVPPKLPDTTNLVFTSSKNEYRETIAIAESITVENRRPPLRKLIRIVSQ